MKKVDFFIAGVQKAGTTALDSMLRSSNAIQMADKKEVHFFDDERSLWNNPDYGGLNRHFDWSNEDVVRGESTPIYTYWPNSMQRIARYNPDARIIICLRHPAYRAYSHWRMEISRGREGLSFAEAIRAGRSRFNGPHRTFSYVERGFYSSQIRDAQSLFRSVHVLQMDDLWTHPHAELTRLGQFLGVSLSATQRRYIVPVENKDRSAIEPIDLDYLKALYADDIKTTAILSGLNLRNWLEDGYEEAVRQAN